MMCMDCILLGFVLDSEITFDTGYNIYQCGMFVEI